MSTSSWPFRHAIVGALLLAAVSTAADYVWALQIPRHQLSSGLIHASVLFVVLGGYLGWLARRPVAGALGGWASGAVAAASFYALAPVAGYNAMIVSWVVLWLSLAALGAFLDRRARGRAVLLRGLLAAAAAGVGFGLVLYFLYGRWPPATFSPVRHFAAWTVAYVPGLLVLLADRPRALTPGR